MAFSLPFCSSVIYYLTTTLEDRQKNIEDTVDCLWNITEINKKSKWGEIK